MKINFEELTSNKLKELIRAEKTFEVTGLSGRINEAVKFVENTIESEGLRVRVYTYGRIAAAGGTLFGGITGALGLASVVGMAAHNLATLNPDYEIAKHLVDNMLTVKYCKK
ncbi:hypothetical protein CWC25_05775 [Pseudoalteromonas sp. S4389]|uniref:hypothetical protein n=1 Tax=Pseudoalteromonas sp. S4389 TaxID=579556 RepID=UPI0011099869|nr:hypothetical protein [Pseudoalteromonas sp. S4389]TMO45621.1 hypothetical protein CWC25_05775 [Pseudoalteromonas sp. S4389]